MNCRISFFLLLLSFSICVCNNSYSQVEYDTTLLKQARIIIVTNDGGVHVGQLIDENEREYVLQTEDKGKLFIPKYAVKRIEPVTDKTFKEGKYRFPNPHDTRYFFSPTAIGLKRGEGYLQGIYGLVWQVQYALADGISIGALTSIMGTPICITPKVSFPIVNKLYGSVGVLVGTAGLFAFEEGGGIAYGVMTYGTGEHNTTFGLGKAFIFREQVEGIVLNLAGMTRVSPHVTIMGEFWIFPGEGWVVGGPGVRWLRNEKNSFDFGFVTEYSEFEGYLIPYIDWVWKF